MSLRRPPAGFSIATAMGLAAAAVWFAAASMNVALREIGGDLAASSNGLQWAVNAYLLALAGSLVIGGRAGDLFGRRRLLVAGLVAFAGASVLAGIAPSLPLLVAARGLMGVAGGLALPQTLSLIAQAYGEDRRGRAVGVWAMVAALGEGGAAPVGGFITELLGWRWMLLVDVPFAALAIAAIVVARVPESERRPGLRLDVFSAALFAAAAVGLVAALTELDETSFAEPDVLVPLVAGAVLLAVFVIVTRRSRQPLFDLGLLRRARFVAAIAINLFANAALMAVLFVGPMYLTAGLELSTAEASAVTLGAMVAMVAAALPAGWASDRISERATLAAGAALMAAGTALLALAGDGAAAAALAAVAFALVAGGQGFAIVPASKLALGAVGPRESGAAAGILKTTSMLGSALGVALAGAAYNIFGARELHGVLSDHGIAVGAGQISHFVDVLSGGSDRDVLASFPPALRSAVESLVPGAAVGAFATTMWIVTALSALLAAAIVAWRRPRGRAAAPIAE